MVGVLTAAMLAGGPGENALRNALIMEVQAENNLSVSINPDYPYYTAATNTIEIPAGSVFNPRDFLKINGSDGTQEFHLGYIMNSGATYYCDDWPGTDNVPIPADITGRYMLQVAVLNAQNKQVQANGEVAENGAAAVMNNIRNLIIRPKANTAPTLELQNVRFKQGDTTADLKSMIVSANDAEDGPLTPTLVSDGGFDINTPGTYKVSYKVTDSGGLSTVKEAEAVVYSTKKPTIVAHDTTINAGDELKVMTLVDSAHDDEDGTITNKVRVKDLGGFNETSAVPGEYTVTFEVQDSDGNVGETTAKITVLSNEPTLEVQPTVEKHVFSPFDPKSLIEKASDPQDGDLKDKVEVNPTQIDMTKPGKYRITYKVKDKDGNEATATSTLTVVNDPPTIEAKDATIEKMAPFDWKTLIVSAADTEDGDLKDKVELVDNGGFDSRYPGVYTFKFKVTDRNGEVAETTAKVTVEGTDEAPTLKVKDAEILVGQPLDLRTLIVSANDPEDGNLKAKVTIDDDGGFDASKRGVYKVKYSVVDKAGNVDSKVATVKVKGAGIPVITEALTPTLHVYQTPTVKDLVENATDPEDGDLTDKVTIKDKSKYNPDVPGTYPIVVEVTDSEGNQVEKTVHVKVVNDPPVIVTEPKTLREGDPFDLKELVKSATDTEDGDMITKVVIENDGGFKNDKPGEYEVTFKTTDKQGAVGTAKEKVIVIAKKAPQIEVTPETEIFVGDKLDLMKLVESAKDQEDGDLMKKVVIEDEGGFNADLPGRYEITFSVTDSDGLTAKAVAIVYVTNTPPEIETKNVTIKKGESLDLMTLVKSATDMQDGDLMDKVEIADKGGFDPDKPGVYAIRFKVEDRHGSFGNATAIVTVEESYPPVIELRDPLTIHVYEKFTKDDLVEKATDAEDGDVTKKVEIVDKGGFDESKPGTYDIIVAVKDNDGNETKATAKVTVINDAPTIETESTTVRVGETVDLMTLVRSANDYEDGDLRDKVTVKDDGGVNFDKPGTYVITYEVKDRQGAKTEAQATVKVVPVNVPLLETEDKHEMHVGSKLDLKSLVTRAEDKEDGDLMSKVEIVDKGGFNPDRAGEYTIRFKVKDKDGNTAEATTKVIVINDAPTIDAVPKTIRKGEKLDLMTLVISAEDKEDGNLISKATLLNDGGFDTDVPGTYHVTFEVKDKQGLTAKKTVIVTVLEKNAPFITVTPKTKIHVGESLDIKKLATSAKDKEDGDLTKKIRVRDDGGFDPNRPGEYTIIFEVKDSDGMIGEARAVVEVINDAPTISAESKTIHVGEKFELVTLVTEAKDREDGNLMGRVFVKDSGRFDSKKEGTYKVTFAVIDSMGAEALTTVEVKVVKPAPAQPKTEKPKKKAAPKTGVGMETWPLIGALIGLALTKRRKKDDE